MSAWVGGPLGQPLVLGPALASPHSLHGPASVSPPSPSAAGQLCLSPRLTVSVSLRVPCQPTPVFLPRLSPSRPSLPVHLVFVPVSLRLSPCRLCHLFLPPSDLSACFCVCLTTCLSLPLLCVPPGSPCFLPSLSDGLCSRLCACVSPCPPLTASGFLSQVLNEYFHNVCELDLVFNFYKVGPGEDGAVGTTGGGGRCRLRAARLLVVPLAGSGPQSPPAPRRRPASGTPSLTPSLPTPPFTQVYTVVDEMFLAGEIRETSQTKVLKQLLMLQSLE